MREDIPAQMQKPGSGSYPLRYIGWGCICVTCVVDWALLYQDGILGFVDEQTRVWTWFEGRKHQKNGSVVGIVNNFVRDMFWHPTKPKFQEWVDFKALDFAREESEGSWLNPTKWLEWYLYTDIHEILFAEFPSLLYEWLLKLATQKKYFQGRESTEGFLS